MVEKVITSRQNVVDFARYRAARDDSRNALAIKLRVCRHCCAALSEGESESECSSAFNTDATAVRVNPRKFYSD